jgi:hypothetical protein
VEEEYIMGRIPEPNPSEIEDVRRKADDFAREVFAAVLKRFAPLRQEVPESASEDVPAADAEPT